MPGQAAAFGKLDQKRIDEIGDDELSLSMDRQNRERRAKSSGKAVTSTSSKGHPLHPPLDFAALRVDDRSKSAAIQSAKNVVSVPEVTKNRTLLSSPFSTGSARKGAIAQLPVASSSRQNNSTLAGGSSPTRPRAGIRKERDRHEPSGDASQATTSSQVQGGPLSGKSKYFPRDGSSKERDTGERDWTRPNDNRERSIVNSHSPTRDEEEADQDAAKRRSSRTTTQAKYGDGRIRPTPKSRSGNGQAAGPSSAGKSAKKAGSRDAHTEENAKAQAHPIFVVSSGSEEEEEQEEHEPLQPRSAGQKRKQSGQNRGVDAIEQFTDDEGDVTRGLPGRWPKSQIREMSQESGRPVRSRPPMQYRDGRTAPTATETKPRKAGTRSVSAPQKPPVNVMRIKKYKQDGNTIDKNADVVSWKEDMLSISSTNFKFDEMANLLIATNNDMAFAFCTLRLKTGTYASHYLLLDPDTETATEDWARLAVELADVPGRSYVPQAELLRISVQCRDQLNAPGEHGQSERRRHREGIRQSQRNKSVRDGKGASVETRGSRADGSQHRGKDMPAVSAVQDGVRSLRVTPARIAQAEQPRQIHMPPNTFLCRWPPEGRSELQITAGDYYRLDEEEFLNDTLVDFGLRHIAANMQPVPVIEAPILSAAGKAESPKLGSAEAHSVAAETSALADDKADSDRTHSNYLANLTSDDVHVFNPFFYKKISAKTKDKAAAVEDGDHFPDWPAYNSVAKWTAKVDIFSKKFLVVPINEHLHWYMAIIYNPGAVLAESKPEYRYENGVKAALQAVRSSARIATAESRTRESSTGSREVGTDAEMAPAPPTQRAEGSRAVPVVASEEEEEEEEERDPLALQSGNQEYLAETLPGPSSDAMDVDLKESTRLPGSAEIDLTSDQSEDNGGAPDLGVDELTIGASSKAKGKRPAGKRASPAPSTVKSEAADIKALPEFHNLVEQGLIMTFDSLAGQHQAAGNALNRWLAYEAHHKKQIDLYWETKIGRRPLPTKSIKAPEQPNFSDCGVYLLHYLRQILRDPQGMMEYIFESLSLKRPTKAADVDRDRRWEKEAAVAGRMEWKGIIEALSKQQGKWPADIKEKDENAPVPLQQPEGAGEEEADESQEVQVLEHNEHQPMEVDDPPLQSSANPAGVVTAESGGDMDIDKQIISEDEHNNEEVEAMPVDETKEDEGEVDLLVTEDVSMGGTEDDAAQQHQPAIVPTNNPNAGASGSRSPRAMHPAGYSHRELRHRREHSSAEPPQPLARSAVHHMVGGNTQSEQATQRYLDCTRVDLANDTETRTTPFLPARQSTSPVA